MNWNSLRSDFFKKLKRNVLTVMSYVLNSKTCVLEYCLISYVLFTTPIFHDVFGSHIRPTTPTAWILLTSLGHYSTSRTIRSYQIPFDRQKEGSLSVEDEPPTHPQSNAMGPGLVAWAGGMKEALSHDVLDRRQHPVPWCLEKGGDWYPYSMMPEKGRRDPSL